MLCPVWPPVASRLSSFPPPFSCPPSSTRLVLPLGRVFAAVYRIPFHLSVARPCVHPLLCRHCPPLGTASLPPVSVAHPPPHTFPCTSGNCSTARQCGAVDGTLVAIASPRCLPFAQVQIQPWALVMAQVLRTADLSRVTRRCLRRYRSSRIAEVTTNLSANLMTPPQLTKKQLPTMCRSSQPKKCYGFLAARGAVQRPAVLGVAERRLHPAGKVLPPSMLSSERIPPCSCLAAPFVVFRLVESSCVSGMLWKLCSQLPLSSVVSSLKTPTSRRVSRVWRWGRAFKPATHLMRRGVRDVRHRILDVVTEARNRTGCYRPRHGESVESGATQVWA